MHSADRAQVDFVKTIHHGIPEDLLTPQPVKQEYAAFLGRVSPEKGVDKAIRIAGKAGARVEDRRKGG
jgi:glycosyltransferase involved in cell wall biosynthesis